MRSTWHSLRGVNQLNTTSLQQFQKQVGELLLRHRSILDILSKYHQAGGSVHRAVVKSITECGCIEVVASKQEYTADMTIQQARDILKTHVSGELCETCAEIIREELGKNLFYIASLCNVLNIDLQTVVEEESKKCTALGVFKMT